MIRAIVEQMALITEQAMGMASTGMFKGKVQRILSLQPTSVHERCPIIMGCERDVSQILDGYKTAVKPSWPTRAKI